MYKFVIGFALMVFTFWSCTEEISNAGLGLLPVGDLVHVDKYVETNIKSFTKADEKQRTDESSFNLLGTYNDPIFGKTTADFACQFRLSKFPDFTKAAQPDSLVLYLLYMETYGDTVTPQKFKVYELGSDLSFDDKYYQDVNLKALSKGEVLGEKDYIPKFRLDSLSSNYGSTNKIPKDTVVQEIAIKLNSTLLNKLFSADSLTLSDNDRFLKFFKGLYVEAGDLGQGGAIMKINTLAQGSHLVLHYHNSEADSLYVSYGINANSARVSRYNHDYSKTVFVNNLVSEVKQDSLIYLQTTGGLRSKIYIPNLDNWIDSTNLTINKAEIIFKTEARLSELLNFLPGEQLVLAAIDSVGNGYLPSDHTFSPTYYGGKFTVADQTYRFNITKHLQDIIEKKKGKENHGFYLETSFKNSSYRRVVLKGGSSKTGIRLAVTYSKLKK